MTSVRMNHCWHCSDGCLAALNVGVCSSPCVCVCVSFHVLCLLSLHIWHSSRIMMFCQLIAISKCTKELFYVFVLCSSFSACVQLSLYVTWNHLMRDISLLFVLWFCHTGSRQIPICVFVHMFWTCFVNIFKSKKATFWVTSRILLSFQELQL